MASPTTGASFFDILFLQLLTFLAPSNQPRQLPLAFAAKVPQRCNETIYSSMTQKSTTYTFTRKSKRIQPLNCRFSFNASVEEYVEVFVKSLSAGKWNKNTESCDGGYLQISDGTDCSLDPMWLASTRMCGDYPVNKILTRRLTRGSAALVDFVIQSEGAFLFEVTFKKRSTNTKKLPYGNFHRTDGQIERTKCDWLIPVDKCEEHCYLVSPGWPGVYAPNTRCHYLLTDFNQERVELAMGGDKFRGKFDLKYSENCTEDYVDIYDGPTILSPLIGRFCGHVGPRVISTGASLLVIFQSGPGGPNWDYSGFSGQATTRWAETHGSGVKVRDTACDWRFSVVDGDDGNTHTPDYKLEGNTVCNYYFVSDSSKNITVELSIYSLKTDRSEYVEIYKESELVDVISSTNITQGENNHFKYELGKRNASVRYTNTNGQLSKVDLVWIDYRFGDASLLPTYIYTDEKPEVHAQTENNGCETTVALLSLTAALYVLTSSLTGI